MSTTGKSASTTVKRRSSAQTKDSSRSARSQASRTSQSLRLNASHIPSINSAGSKTSSASLQKPLRPPDPTLFIHAGTSGVRHLFPIHLKPNENSGEKLFSRDISRLRSHTPITEFSNRVDMIRNICSSIKTLQHFDVSQNDLHELPLDICLLIDLETLNCSHNQLQNLDELFEQLKYLKDLDLSFNNFKEIPSVVYTYKSLVRLNVEHNAIGNVDSTLLNLKRLKVLICDHNHLETTEMIDFAQIKKLEYIHIAHNQLVKFPRGLQQLHHLKNVNLSHNCLKSFPVDLLLVNTLDVLNLSHNLIVKLPAMPIANKRASMIFSIDLSFNQLNKFYDYLLFIALKIDVSNNKIRSLSSDLMKKLTNDVITSRELKIHNNPLTQPAVPQEMLNETSSTTVNVLRMIRTCFEEQQVDINVRQGFKICIIGPKHCGKTCLATCLEEFFPLNLDDNEEEKQERIVQEQDFEFTNQMISFRTIHQYPFRLSHANELIAASIPVAAKPIRELPKLLPQRNETDVRKRRNPVGSTNNKLAPLASLPAGPSFLTTAAALPTSSTLSMATGDAIKVVPLTIFDFNGSADYYDHISTFLDSHALHFVCIPPVEFQQIVPNSMEDLFNGKFDLSSSSILLELTRILQFLCDKASKTRAIFIQPVATCIDLYDTRPPEDRVDALSKINRFFRLYLQNRLERIKSEMNQIQNLSTISSSLSDRLKTYTTLLNIQIQVEPCLAVSSITFQGIEDLNRAVQRSVLTNKTTFPHVDRILPTLWAEANQFIESLADLLPVPYLLWENFTERVISKHGLAHLIDDITMSLHDEGKIYLINEVATTDRVVFLRPSWLTDLLYNLFRADMRTTYLDYEKNEIFQLTNLNENRFQIYKKEFLQNGLLHTDLLRSLWSTLIYKKDAFYHIWLTLMRFLLVAYPKMNKSQLKRLVHVQTPEPLINKGERKLTRPTEIKYDKDELQFDYAIVPFYLPILPSHDQQDEIQRFHHFYKNIIVTRYTSLALPSGIFHRYSVSAILRLNIVYKKHWSNFIVGEHEEKDVRFLMETDHRTYIICHCATNMSQQPFEEIWNVLMPILNHYEEMFASLAPGNRFDRSVQCPYCHQFSFMGEWTTPKELQCTKTRACSMCAYPVDTARLVQPNESKRRSEELLKRIRERHEKNTPKESDETDASAKPSVPQLLVSPV